MHRRGICAAEVKRVQQRGICAAGEICAAEGQAGAAEVKRVQQRRICAAGGICAAEFTSTQVQSFASIGAVSARGDKYRGD